MDPQVFVVAGLAVVMIAALGVGIVRTLRMEDDEHPKDREKRLEEFALANGFKWKAEQNLLAQSRLPALSAFGAATFAIHFLERDDDRFETIIFDLGHLLQGDESSRNPTDEFGNRSIYGPREYDSEVDLGSGRAVLSRTVFAFRLVRVQMPELTIDRRHRRGLKNIPETLHNAFDTVWSVETAEDWIVFHRRLVRAQSTQEHSFSDALAAAEELRDAILGQWGLI